MEYLLLIYEAEEIWENKTEAERAETLEGFLALNQQLERDGAAGVARPLMPTATALSVRVRGGAREVTDGPFAETKEQLAGFYLVNVDSMDQALEYAAMIPASRLGTVEVRPVADHSEYVRED